MTYALIENGTVANLICLHPMNAADFPNAVPLGDIPAGIGDAYAQGAFYRDGQPVRPEAQRLEAQTKALETALAEADAALLELTYQSILGGTEE